MKKIGLSLAYKHTNYGTLLQTFATQRVIDTFGCETEIFDYSGMDLITYPEAIMYFGIKRLQKIIKRNVSETKMDALHTENKKAREAVAVDFRNRYLHDIINFIDMDKMADYAEDCFAVLVGSDQLWGPSVAFTRFRSLMFVPEGVRRISYATSMGVSSYPWYVKRAAKIFLNKIDYLSVRENRAKEIISDISGKDANLVLDPTYLISCEDWDKLILPRKVTEDGYVLCYFLGDNAEAKKLAKLYAHQHSKRVVAILSNEVCVDDSYADELIIGRSPDDFVNLIRNADYVFTDSFHGFAFSIINRKQVFVTYRRIHNTRSKNSRIDNIVKTFSINHRLIMDYTINPDNIEQIDYTAVSAILEGKREESLSFLRNALGV